MLHIIGVLQIFKKCCIQLTRLLFVVCEMKILNIYTDMEMDDVISLENQVILS